MHYALPDYSCAVPRIFCNLNLHGATPPRVQPLLGEWGPAKVPTTKQKKRMRIWVGLALLGDDDRDLPARLVRLLR